jgi:hypothetical protein
MPSFFGYMLWSGAVLIPLLLLLGAQDVGGALGSGEQVLAVLAVEESRERLDAAHDHQQIVARRAGAERGVDQIVTRALVAEIDLQAVVQEGEEAARPLVNNRRKPRVTNEGRIRIVDRAVFAMILGDIRNHRGRGSDHEFVTQILSPCGGYDFGAHSVCAFSVKNLEMLEIPCG